MWQGSVGGEGKPPQGVALRECGLATAAEELVAPSAAAGRFILRTVFDCFGFNKIIILEVRQQGGGAAGMGTHEIHRGGKAGGWRWWCRGGRQLKRAAGAAAAGRCLPLYAAAGWHNPGARLFFN